MHNVYKDKPSEQSCIIEYSINEEIIKHVWNAKKEYH